MGVRVEGERSAEGEALTQVVLAVFRVNGRLLEVGDALASSQGLTAASWQVLGALALAGRPLTVPQIARRMGLTRQSVHATVNRVVAEGLLALTPNAEHQRSYLVQPTRESDRRYATVDQEQIRWSNRVAATMRRSNLETTARTLDEFCTRLETDLASSPEPASPTTNRKGRR